MIPMNAQTGKAALAVIHTGISLTLAYYMIRMFKTVSDNLENAKAIDVNKAS